MKKILLFILIGIVVLVNLVNAQSWNSCNDISRVDIVEDHCYDFENSNNPFFNASINTSDFGMAGNSFLKKDEGSMYFNISNISISTEDNYVIEFMLRVHDNSDSMRILSRTNDYSLNPETWSSLFIYWYPNTFFYNFYDYGGWSSDPNPVYLNNKTYNFSVVVNSNIISMYRDGSLIFSGYDAHNEMSSFLFLTDQEYDIDNLAICYGSECNAYGDGYLQAEVKSESNATILEYSVIIDGNHYWTNDGVIRTFITKENKLVDVTLFSNDHGNFIFNNVNISEDLFLIMGNADTHFEYKSVCGNITVTNFRLGLDGYSLGTENGSMYFNPRINQELQVNNSFTWNHTRNFTFDSSSSHYIYEGAFDTYLKFIDNSSWGKVMYPNCDYAGYNFSNGQLYEDDIAEKTVVCNQPGFYPRVFEVTTAVQPTNTTINMDSYVHEFLFDNYVHGWVLNDECTNGGCFKFYSDRLNLSILNLSGDYTSIQFNNNSQYDKFQQTYVFNNDNNSVPSNPTQLKIINSDLEYNVLVTADSQVVEGARVCSMALDNSIWIVGAREYLYTFCDYTNFDGEATMMVYDQNIYKFCVDKVGYTTNCKTIVVDPSTSSTLEIVLNDITTLEDYNAIIMSNCNAWEENNTLCNMTIEVEGNVNSIEVLHTSGEGSSLFTYNNINTVHVEYILNEFTVPYKLNVTVNGFYEQGIVHQGVDTKNESISVAWGDITTSDDDFFEILSSDRNYYTFFIGLMIVLSIIIGLTINKLWYGYGIYGVMLFFFMMGAFGFTVFFTLALPIFIYLVFNILKPLLGSKSI